MIELKQTLTGNIELTQNNQRVELPVDECLELLTVIIPWNKRRFGRPVQASCNRRFSVMYNKESDVLVVWTYAPMLTITHEEYPQFCADLLKMCATLLPRAL